MAEERERTDDDIIEVVEEPSFWEGVKSLSLGQIVAIGARLFALIVLAAATGGAVLMVAKFAAGGPVSPRFSPWNTIFASRLMLIFIRLTILVFAVYAILSMLVFMARGQWITRVGPVEVSESLKTLTAERDEARTIAEELLTENERLEGEIEELRELLDESDRMLEYLAGAGGRPPTQAEGSGQR